MTKVASLKKCAGGIFLTSKVRAGYRNACVWVGEAGQIAKQYVVLPGLLKIGKILSEACRFLLLHY